MQTDSGPDSTPKQRSSVMFIIAILVMLIPALIPIYLAFSLEDHTLIFLVGGLLLAVFNVTIVVALWNWAGALTGTESDKSDKSDKS